MQVGMMALVRPAFELFFAWELQPSRYSLHLLLPFARLKHSMAAIARQAARWAGSVGLRRHDGQHDRLVLLLAVARLALLRLGLAA